MENRVEERKTKININNYIKELAVSSLTAVIMLTIALVIIRCLNETGINTFINMITTIGVIGLIIVLLYSISILTIIATQKLKQLAKFISRKA